jgi:hypothetical protein
MKIVAAGLLSVFVVSQSAAGQPACAVREISNHGDYLTFSGYSVHLMGGDDDPASDSTAWQGPVIVTSRTGKTCSTDIAIISAPFFLAGSHYLYITSYSGSLFYQDVLNVDDCSDTWHKDGSFVGPPHFVKGDTFTYKGAEPVKIGPNCLPIGSATPSKTN